MSRRKQDVFEELLLEVRRSQNATDRFDQAVADAIGLNRTDMRCLDIVEMEGSVTAGRLAELSGLTTGAITTVHRPPRASRPGAACARSAGPPARAGRDRRRGPPAAPPTTTAATWRWRQRMYKRYTQEQLEFLLEFVREGREFNERAAAELEARTRSARAS